MIIDGIKQMHKYKKGLLNFYRFLQNFNLSPLFNMISPNLNKKVTPNPIDETPIDTAEELKLLKNCEPKQALNTGTIPRNMPETFCVLPWLQLHLTSRGEHLPCCMSSRNEADLSRTNNDDLFHINDSDISEAMSSNNMKLLRNQLLQGKRPESCSACWKNESVGMLSHRQNMNQNFADSIEGILNQPDPTEWSHSMEFLDIQIGNKCNQACRMCDPLSSHKLMDEFFQINNQSDLTSFAKKERYHRLNWPSKEHGWENLRTKSSQLRMLKYWGGEPLINPKARDYIQYLSDAGYSKNIQFFINTNAHALKPEYLDLMSQFKQSEILVSIDGYRKVNEYIRYPSSWADIDDKFNTFNEWKKTSKGNVNLYFSITVQAMNILDIPNLVSYLKRTFNDTNVRPLPYFNILYSPHYYSAQILPTHIKKIAANNLENLKTPESNNMQIEFNRGIDSIVKFLFQDDLTQHIPEFKKVTEIYDRNRKQQLADYMPELLDL